MLLIWQHSTLKLPEQQKGRQAIYSICIPLTGRLTCIAFCLQLNDRACIWEMIYLLPCGTVLSAVTASLQWHSDSHTLFLSPVNHNAPHFYCFAATPGSRTCLEHLQLSLQPALESAGFFVICFHFSQVNYSSQGDPRSLLWNCLFTDVIGVDWNLSPF